jgi:hypothetical protein
VTFSSAYAANASAVQTILGKEDIVVSDQLNHASIIDAVRVAGVQNKFAYSMEVLYQSGCPWYSAASTTVLNIVRPMKSFSKFR